MPRLPPLQVSFEPVPIPTTRRIYIQNLVNLLHHAIRTRNQLQASKAWGILIRCEEVDWKTSWKWALPVFDLEIDAARRAEAGSSTQRRGAEPEEVRDIWQRKEKYLRRLLVSVPLIHRPEVLLTLILHLIEVREHQRALDDLELYLMSYPYILSSTLHAYAGLLCFYLSQPVATRQSSQRPIGIPPGTQTNSEMDHDDASDESDDSTAWPSRKNQQITAESLGMNERFLRNALVHFTKALEREKENNGIDGSQGDPESVEPGLESENKAKLRLAHGTAKVSQTFIDEIDSLLREEASDDEEGDDLHAERIEADEDGQPDEKGENEDEGGAGHQIFRTERSELAMSPPPTPSTVAGKLSDIGLEDSTFPATRASLRNRHDDRDRRDREGDEDLSDGDGSVYSELSIG